MKTPIQPMPQTEAERRWTLCCIKLKIETTGEEGARSPYEGTRARWAAGRRGANEKNVLNLRRFRLLEGFRTQLSPHHSTEPRTVLYVYWA